MIISGGLMALFLWLLLRNIKPRARHHPCVACFDTCHWNGKTFIHDKTGLEVEYDAPPMEIDPLDPHSDFLSHRATPDISR